MGYFVPFLLTALLIQWPSEQCVSVLWWRIRNRVLKWFRYKQKKKDGSEWEGIAVLNCDRVRLFTVDYRCPDECCRSRRVPCEMYLLGHECPVHEKAAGHHSWDSRWHDDCVSTGKDVLFQSSADSWNSFLKECYRRSDSLWSGESTSLIIQYPRLIPT